MDKLDRRSFLRSTAVLGGSLFAIEGLVALGAREAQAAVAPKGRGGYGPLFPTRSVNTNENLLELPEGFQYTVFGKGGTIMTDGRPTPGGHDGMAAFAVGSRLHLVRNHELSGGTYDMSRPYDPAAIGGTTTLVLDPGTRLLVEDYLSQSGTLRNCAGGITPWGSWITCEETTQNANNTFQQNHGYNFEVPADLKQEIVPVPYKAMGRFTHEAIAVDPATRIVYETEDANPSGFYRFIPDQPGTDTEPPNYAAGGLLQMLAVTGRPNYDTRRGQRAGYRLLCTWVSIDNPDPAPGATSVVDQGLAKGGAPFARLEGAWQADGAIYFNATSGGDINAGQVWEYRPMPEGDGYLTLIYESRSIAVLRSPDNICVSPRGGLILCEDTSSPIFLRGLTRRGEIFNFARQTAGEFAGACFSPDGQTLFVNIQVRGHTYAIWPKPGFSWGAGAL